MPGPQRVAQSKSQEESLSKTPSKQNATLLQSLTQGTPLEGPNMVQQTQQVQGLQSNPEGVSNPESPLFQGSDTVGAEEIDLESDANPFKALRGATDEQPVAEPPPPEEAPTREGIIEDIRAQFADEINKTKFAFKQDFAESNFQKFELAKKTFGDRVSQSSDGETILLDGVDIDKGITFDDVFDLSREVFEGFIEGGVRFGSAAGTGIAGGKLGLMLGGSAGLATPVPGGAAAGGLTVGGAMATAGAIAGFGASGALAGTTAFTAAEKFSQWLGVPQDPSRNIPKEAAVAGAMAAGFNVFGGILRKNKAANDITSKANTEYINEETTSKAVQEAKDAMNSLKNSGIVSGVDEAGNKVVMLAPNQMFPNIPEASITAEKLSTEPAFRSFFTEQGNVLTAAYNKIAASLGNVVKPNQGLGNRFVNSIKDIGEYEGKLVGKYTKEAVERNPKALTSIDNMATKVDEMLDLVGGTVETRTKDLRSVGGKLTQTHSVVVDPERLRETFSGLTPRQAKDMAKELSDWGNLIKNAPNGQVSVEKLHSLYEKLKLKKSGLFEGKQRPLGHKMNDLFKELQKDWFNTVDNQLADSDSFKAWRGARDKYSAFKIHTKELRQLLKTDNISKEALMTDLFENKASLDRLHHVKALILEDDPELWKDLTGEYFQRMLREAKDKGGNTDWGKVSDKMKKLDKGEVLDTLFTDSAYTKEEFRAFITVADRVKNAEFPFSPKDLQRNGMFGALVKGFRVLATPFLSSKQSQIELMLAELGKDKAIVKFLAEDGLEEVLKFMPQTQRKGLRAVLYPAISQLAATTLRQRGQDIVRPATKKDLFDENK